jgi:hypothetical protein
MVKVLTVVPVVAKHAFPPNVGLESRVTVPFISPGDDGGLNVTVAFTVESNGEPPPVVKPSSEPEAEPDEIVGRNVATKLPGLLSVALLQAEASPTGT